MQYFHVGGKGSESVDLCQQEIFTLLIRSSSNYEKFRIFGIHV